MWATAGQITVWVILGSAAIYLYWQAVKWCADALYIADMRAQERVSQRALLEIADYLENVQNRKHEQLSEWDREREGPFMDTQFPDDPGNDSLLFHQLKKSVEQTKRGPKDAA